MVLAGGSALNCLLAVPSEHKNEDAKQLAEWLGPDSIDADSHQATAVAHADDTFFSYVSHIIRAKSGYGSSDVDLFITGLSEEEATKKLDKIIRHICGKLEEGAVGLIIQDS